MAKNLQSTTSTNALDQYLELYSDNREAIDARSAEPLNRLRPRAFEALQGRRLPHRGDEGYEKTSIADMMAPDYGVNITGVNIPVNVAKTFRCDVPNMTTWLGLVINDEFHPASTLQGKLPQGVIFASLRDVARHNRQLVERYYGSVAPLQEVPVALNTLLAQDGVMVYVPRGVKLDKPLQLVNIFSSATPLLAWRRLLIVLEEDSEAQLLICDHTQDSTTPYFSSQVIEVVVGRHARFDYYDIEESSPLTSRHSMLWLRQDEGSNVVVDGMTLTNGSTRNDYHFQLDAPHCETLLAGMAIGSASQHIDNDSQVDHNAPHCHSNQLFKYVLDQQATGAFEGAIKVNPTAPFTEAYQSCRNILASPEARMHTKPQLEIYNDDVKCSHGATTGQLPADQLFYMRTRGIPLEEARTMLMEAFVMDVIDTVRMEALRERLRHLIEKRFKHSFMACSDCQASSSTCRKP
ncbi:MAG: Fe-S cluster assembly protein SufD [Bacteroidales bacterium]|nr:Fe-S cluster assembly protein SufD [Bacteroidales bacterium]